MGFLSSFLRRQSPKVIAKCGHETHRRGSIAVGERTIQVGSKGTPVYCLACVKRLVTVCAVCGKPILLDEPVMQNVDLKIIGKCCTEMGLADCNGRWTDEGYKQVPFPELMGID